MRAQHPRHRWARPAPTPRRQFVKCANEACKFFAWVDELQAGPDGSPAPKRRITGGDGGGYQPAFGGYGGSAPGSGGPPAADGGVLRDRSNDVCYK